ncbi:MAG TPA: PepSY domain-containing protein [Pyrinomonadaceae bacterium]
MKYRLVLSLLFVLISSMTTWPSSINQDDQETKEQQKLARLAKVTKEAAQETALKRAPGNVESSELEKEHGKLVYSFDIRNEKGTITEVQVSAITGKVVRVEHESKQQEEAEKKKEKKP